MAGELSAEYKSNSQRARVVTESWGEQNLYCPNCASSKLTRLAHNTQASDFSCPDCHFWFQLKGQKSAIGRTISDGAYASMMRAIQTDKAPSYYFMQYDAATWTVRHLLLVPHFAFPPSAIVKRNPLSATARRAGWVGCNFALDRIPADARIPIVTEAGRRRSEVGGNAEPSPHPSRPMGAAREQQSDGGSFLNFQRLIQAPAGKPSAAGVWISSPEEVRAKFHRLKPLKDLAVSQRGWTLDVLNIVRSLAGAPSPQPGLPSHPMGAEREQPSGDVRSSSFPKRTPQRSVPTFTNADVYAHERELEQLHPDNRHIRDKIRQQLQVLRDMGLLAQVERGVWRIV